MSYRILDERDIASLNKNYSNAIKGNLKGKVVVADDVSPNEHRVNVRVRSKNLVNVPDVIIQETTGYHKPIALSFKVEVGETYTVSMTVESTVEPFIISIGYGDAVSYYIDGAYSRNHYNGRIEVSFTPTKDLLTKGSYVHIRAPRYAVETTFSATISDIQLEEGDTATEYTPYVDLSTVEVTRCGKNIIPYPYASSKQDYNGIVFTPNADGSVTINGTATGDGISFMLVNTGAGLRKNLPAGTYFLSCPEIENTDILLSLFYYDSNEGSTFNGTCGKNKSFTLDKSQYYGLYFRVYGGTTVNNLIVHPQLVLGDSATEYEAYKGETYSPSADGTVEGVTSVSPTMTLLTDNNSAIIECEYAKDLNAVIKNLTDAVIALGGTV